MSAKILVCDDDSVYAGMILAMLESLGYTAYRTHDTAQLSMAIRDSVPDLFILDMQMPAGGGPAAVKLLRGDPRTALIPIIISSGMPTIRQEAWFVGQDRMAFLQKPVEVAALAAIVRDILQGGAKPDFRASSVAAVPSQDAAISGFRVDALEAHRLETAAPEGLFKRMGSWIMGLFARPQDRPGD